MAFLWNKSIMHSNAVSHHLCISLTVNVTTQPSVLCHRPVQKGNLFKWKIKTFASRFVRVCYRRGESQNRHSQVWRTGYSPGHRSGLDACASGTTASSSRGGQGARKNEVSADRPDPKEQTRGRGDRSAYISSTLQHLGPR